MRKFDIIVHESIGDILHVDCVGIRPKRSLWLLLDHSYAEAQSFLHEVKVAIDDLNHS
ncbi:hypothetical protein YGS_C1P0734 [Sphingobium sp. YG1]|nr:hypothetical protein YGS_C1P0734 [Sphingobium sp. YG1]